MGTLRGTVEDLMISRETGRFMLRTPSAKFGAAVLVLYRDTGVDAVDPTEMVRRNWMVGLLQQSLTRGMEVTVDYGPKITVQSVTLHTNITKQASTSGGKWTKGIVKKIRIFGGKGLVTIYGTTTSASGKRTIPGSHYLLIYTNDLLGSLHPEEANRRNRIIGLLRQALADGLDVAVHHAAKSPSLIWSVTLQAKA